MNKSKIEWCDYTLNILTGCLHGCPYCYARTIAKRFCGDIKRNKACTDKYSKEGEIYILDEPFIDESGQQIMYPFGFAPTYHRYRYGDKLGKLKTGQNVFVGAMADVFGKWVPNSIINDIFSECERYPKNNYIFLTKCPATYRYIPLPDHDNYFYGTTITEPSEMYRAYDLQPDRKSFVSFEPLRDDLSNVMYCLPNVDWIIIGAETGNNRDKVIPQKHWIENIERRADAAGIPVFMKDSLADIVGEENMRREFPEELLIKPQSDKVAVRLNDHCMRCKKEMPKNKMISLSAKAKRGGNQATVGYMCKECFTKWCEEGNVSIPDLEGM